MNTTIVNPPELHDPTSFGYSHSTAVRAGTELVLVAGQYGSGPDGSVASTEFGDQVDRAIGNVGLVLAAHGLELAHVVQLRTYVVDLDMAKLGRIAGAIASVWGATPPVHTVVGVAGLATPDIAVEIEAVAARP